MPDRPLSDPLAIGLFSENANVDQLMKARLSKALPKGMELSHFTLLNYLAGIKSERTPAQLAFSPAGARGREAAVAAVAPVFEETMQDLGSDNVRAALPVLRKLRGLLISDL